MKISCHCLIKNEENFIWFAINSVIDYVDELLVWDTGSTDKTIEIIKSIENSKIKFREVGHASPVRISELRQQMLEETNADWLLILDGDEIWYQSSVQKLIAEVNINKEYNIAVVPMKVLIGDIFHYQEAKAGKYTIAGRVGHHTVRALNLRSNNLHVEGIYPNEAYVTDKGIKVQNLPSNKILFLEKQYLHASHLNRSSRDRKKIKYEIGEEFSKDFYYPEVLFKTRPPIIPSPWRSMTLGYRFKSELETPFKKVKRRIR